MAENARNFAIVIQEFLNVKSKQSVEGALGFDKCLLVGFFVCLYEIYDKITMTIISIT